MSNKVLKIKCPTCGKEGHEKDRYVIGTDLWIDLLCGHTIIRDALADAGETTIMSSDGRSPFPFQMESAKFLEAADCNGLCLHEQGLGKTIIECLLLKRNPQLLPALIVVKSGLRAQWFAEIVRWTGMAPQVIMSSRELPYFDFFDVVIVSHDTLRLLRPDVKVVSDFDVLKAESAGKKLEKKKKVVWTDEICAKFKHIAVDESQKFKKPGSARTQALRLIAKAANDGKGARNICYSGTIIEKHAGEYFVPLNFVKPEIFHNESMYQMRFCEVSPETGKLGGLKDPARFKELTKDFIIRYKREEVMPELPKIFRQFRLAEMEGGELEAYIKIVKEFQQAMEDPEVNLSQSDILGYLSRMRHITGIAKVDAAVQFLEEFLLESDRKIVVFLHHQMAGAILMSKIEQLCKDGAYNPPLYLHAGLDPMTQRPALIEEFRKPGNRIMIASTGASAEGLNLQFCQDMLLMERQWNPSTEEQAESRFPRPRPEDPWPPDTKINCHYLIAAGTVDDFLTEIVEVKRRNVNQTLDGTEVAWDQSTLIKELTNAILTRGLKRWSLK